MRRHRERARVGRWFSRPRIGDLLEAAHTCRMSSGPIDHVALVMVLAVHKLNDGGYRAEGLRCDGSAIHFIVSPDGTEVAQ